MLWGLWRESKAPGRMPVGSSRITAQVLIQKKNGLQMQRDGLVKPGLKA
jgi:hypothetical protein